ncbi:hypothetical protein SpCBS45565_g07671 [Spizellomyces sp. 'palustris']|nr:hypothetical protein SpCBS45565_g07671 [Spizellomyces sp. 'palustris']
MMDPTINPSVCEDFSIFKRVLKDLRSLDDNVVPRLNALITRSVDLNKSCRAFYEQLDESYRHRERLISKCKHLTDERIATKRKQLEEQPNDTDLKLSIQADEAKARAINAEFTVEEILRERTSEVFKARCWGTLVSKDFWKVPR